MEEATCERIIKSVDAAIKKDPLLDEFGVIHSASEINKSPVIHTDNKLGLESWCVKYVYKYAYSSILHYHNTGGYEYAECILRWTQFCLLLMPEVTTFWNIRKKIIQKGLLKVDTDLILSKLVLSVKPKCNEAFQHRRWLFTFITTGTQNEGYERNNLALNNNVAVPINPQDFLWNERDLCALTATRKANNYHSWNHRLWVIQKLSQFGNLERIFKTEYTMSQDWVSVHVSEHSGMHYHSKILDFICHYSEKGDLNLNAIDASLNSVQKLLKKELNFNEELLRLYPGHESLFYQRRVTLLKLHCLFGNHGQRATSPPPAYKRPCIETINPEWTAIVQREIAISDEGKRLSEHHDHYRQLCQKHLNWINSVISY